MRVTRLWIRSARRGLLVAVALGLFALPTAVVAQEAAPAQEAPPQGAPPAPAAAPAAPQAPEEPRLGFTSDAGMILFQIRPTETANFESVMNRLKAALAQSDNPQRRQQAAGWKMFKSLEQNPDGNVLYIFAMDPVVPGAEYDATQLLNEAFPAEVQELFNQLKAAVAGLNRINLQEVIDFGS